MKSIHSLTRLLAAVAVVLTTSASRNFAIGTVITVNTTQGTITINGNCSLPEAVYAANTNDGVDACPAGTGIDSVVFAIGSGPQTITVANEVFVSSTLNIDGTTQPGYNAATGVPVITVIGQGDTLFYLEEGATNVWIKHLQLRGSDTAYGNAIYVLGDSNHFVGNYINTDGTAGSYADHGYGVHLLDSSSNVIGGENPLDRNLIGGGRSGVRISGGGGNLIINNYFGLRPDGVTLLTGLSTSSPAIDICQTSAAICMGNTVRGNVIGGFGTGVKLWAGASYNTVTGNRIGIGADGATVVGQTYGIDLVGTHSNTIGGTAAADRNIITGNDTNIHLGADGLSLAHANSIMGNYIGTTADGLGRVQDYGDTSVNYFGIYLTGDGNHIGGTTPGSGNLISANYTGIFVDSEATNTWILGNWIGTDATGAAALQQEAGLYVAGVVNALHIGDGTAAGANTISGGGHAIRFVDSQGSTLSGNRIGLAARGHTPVPNNDGVALEHSTYMGITGNWFGHNLGDGVVMDDTSGVTVSGGNCFTENGNYGVYTSTEVGSQPFSNEWWGSITGPTHSGNPGGTGDAVSDHITYTPFLTLPPLACRLPPADFEGDGATDIGFFRATTGLWGILHSSDGFSYGSPAFFDWGAAGDVAVPGDYDGDGIVDPGFRRPPTGGQSAAYMVLKSSAGYDYGSPLIIPAGWPGLGDTPVPADYNGDGITDPAIFRGNTGVWIIPLSPTFTSYQFQAWGATGDKPVAGDLDGDNIADIGYFRPSTGVWGFIHSGDGFSYASPQYFSWGGATDTPVMRDYDGDGLADPAFVTPPAGAQSAAYRILRSGTGYDYGQTWTIPAGWPGLQDTPVPHDYDHDGKADAAIWRGNTGVWIIPKSSTNNTNYMFAAWGTSGDQVFK